MVWTIAITFVVAAMLDPIAPAVAVRAAQSPALGPTSAPALAAATSAEILITSTGFEPADVIVEPGSQVVWKNTTLAPNSVTSDDDVVASGTIPPDGAFVAAFPGAGRVDIVDAYGNPGSVTVGWAGLDGAPDALASSAIPDTRFPPFTAAEIGVEPESAMLLSRRRLIVGITPGATVAQVNDALSAAGTPLIGSIADDALLLVATPDSGDFTALNAAVDALEADSAIVYAVPDGPAQTTVVPSDPTSAFEADLPGGATAAKGWTWNSPADPVVDWPGVGANWSLENVRAPQAWNLREAIVDAGVDVAAGVVDQAIGDGHPELPNLEQGELCTDGLLFPDCVGDGGGSHGTHVAGIMSSSWDGPVGFGWAGRPSLDNDTRIIGLPWAVEAGFGDPEISSFPTTDLMSKLVSMAEAGVPIRVINYSAAFALDESKWRTAHDIKTCGPGISDDGPGGGGCVPSNDDAWMRMAIARSQPMLAIARRAAANGVLFTVAAGNDGDTWCWTGTTLRLTQGAPSGCTVVLNAARSTSELAYLGTNWPVGQGANPILVVESIGTPFAKFTDSFESFDRTDWSQVGGTISAPGATIYSACLPDDPGQKPNAGTTTDTDPYHCVKSGTSMASPLVASLVLMLSRHSSEPTDEQVHEAILRWAQPSGPATDPASPHIDAFASLLSLPGAAKELVDINDYSTDGNERVFWDASGHLVRDSNGNVVQNTTFDPDDPSDMTAPDGVVDMRDFRRFRDAWLQLCADNHDALCPGVTELVLLDGEDDAPKRDLNFDGCSQRPGGSSCRNDETLYPRFDFNGDGKLTLNDPMPMPLNADGTPAPNRGAATDMTDVAVLASQFTPSPGGWTSADLADLMRSGDLTIDAQGAFAAGATGLLVTARHPDLGDREVSLTITPDEPTRVLTVGAYQDVELTATAQFPTGDTVVRDETLAPFASGEDRFLSACGTIQLEVSPSVVAPGSTADVTATLDPCTPLATPAQPIDVTLSMTPYGSPNATLTDPVPQTDAFGVATTTIQAGSLLGVYTLTATADLSLTGDPVTLYGETSFVVGADYEVDLVDDTRVSGATALGTGPGIDDDGSVAYVAADPSQQEIRVDGAAGNVQLENTLLTDGRAWFGQVTVTDDGSAWAVNEGVEPGDVSGSYQRRREMIRQPVAGGAQERITKSHLNLLGSIDPDAEYELVGLPAPNDAGGVVFPARPLDPADSGPLYRLAAPGDPEDLIGPMIVRLGLDASDGSQPVNADNGATALMALLSAGDPVAAAEALIVGPDVLGIDDTPDGFVLAVNPLNDDALQVDGDGDPVIPDAPGYFFTTPVFSELGRQVAMSSDGRVIAFIGDEGSGLGLYLYLRPDPAGSAFIGPLLVMGANDLAPTPDLGYNGSGDPIFFVDWQLDARLGLYHEAAGPDGLAGDHVVVSFVATPSEGSDQFTNGIGLFTTDVELVSLPEGIFPDPARPAAAVQYGDAVAGGTVVDIGIWDPIGDGPSSDPGDHRLAWWQLLDNGSQQIVRATRVIPTAGSPGASMTMLGQTALGDPSSASDTNLSGPDPDPSAPVELVPAMVVDNLTPTVGEQVRVTNRSRDSAGNEVGATLTTSQGGSPQSLGGGSHGSVTPAAEGPLTVSMTTDDGTSSLAVSLDLVVGAAPNQPPEAQLDGPWVVPDGGRVQLDGSGSSDPDDGDAIVLFEWDFDHDGEYDDSTGPVVDLSVGEFEALACVAGCARDIPLPIALKVTDSNGVFALAGSSLTLSSDPADFVLAIDPAAQLMNPGVVTDLLVNVSGTGGFSDPVSLTIDPLPTGWSASLSTSTVAPNGTAVLHVAPAADAPEADLDISVTGTSGSITHTTSSTASVTFALIPVCYADLVGQLTDADTGEPITTDRVRVAAEDDRGFWSASALPDADGRYAISDVPITTRLLVRATGYADSGYWPTPQVLRQTVCDAVLELDFAMEPTMYGTVVGRVVEGIPDPTDTTSTRTLFPTDVPVEGANASVSGVSGNVTTGPDGTFRIEDIPLASQNAPRTVSVYGGGGIGSIYWGTGVSVQVREGAVIDVGDLPVVERCSVTMHVSGIVRDTNGDPISTGVQLQYQPVVVSNEDGTFEIGPVDVPLLTNNGERELYVHANAPFYGGTGDTRYVTVFGCDELFDLTYEFEVEAVPPPPPVDNLGTVDGHVLDERTGGGVPNAHVILFQDGFPTPYDELTDSQGYFRIEDVLVGTGPVVSADGFSLTATATNRYWDSDFSAEFTVTKDETTTVDMSLEPIDRATATGVVVDRATGQPIEEANVHVGGGGASTAADGTFEITGLMPGEGNVPKVVTTYASKDYGNIGTPGRWYLEWGEAVLEPGGTTDLRFELVKVCEDVSISGLVLDAETRLPLEGAQVSAPGVSMLTGPDGTFLLEGVELSVNNEPATVKVTARKSGYVTLSKYVTVYCGAHVRLDFGAPNGGSGSIAGTVTDQATGAPIAGAFIGSEFGGTDTTDATGHYRLDSAPVDSDGTPRDWLVDVVGPRGATADAVVTVEADAETTQDFVLSVPVNQAPTADPQSVDAVVETPVGIMLTGSDPDGDPLTFDVVTGPSGGTLTGTGAARIYTPDLGTTTDSFTFTVSDSELASTPATVTITVNEPANQPPVVSVDDVSGDTDAPIPMSALAYDLDGDPLTYAWSVDDPVSCSFSDSALLAPSLTCTAPGSYTATLEASDGELVGSDDGLVTVTTPNRPPVVSVDDVSGDTGAPIPMLASASDPDGDSLTYAWSVDGAGCSFSDATALTPELTCTAAGSYTVTLEASDGDLAAADSGAVTIVNPANQPPVVSVDDASGDAGVPIRMAATAVDPDGDPLEFAWSVDSQDCGFSDAAVLTTELTCTVPGSYTVTLDASDGFLTGSDDALVTVTTPNNVPVVSVDDASGETGVPIPMVASASDADGDPLTFEWFVESPDCAFSDPTVLLPSITCGVAAPYTVYLAAFDGRDRSFALATVTVTDGPPNDPPDAVDDTYTTPEDSTLSEPAPGVLADDTDTDPLTASVDTGPANGSLTLEADGSFTYLPDPDFNGSDSFTYTACDPEPLCDTATVTITVTPVNDPPDAVDDAATVAEDDPATPIDVLANDLTGPADESGQTLTISTVSQGAHGTVTITTGGADLSYAPDPDFNGSDSFTYTACDPEPLCDTATVTITVTEVDDPPIADAGPDQSVTVGDLVALDGSGSSDPDADPLTYAWQITSAPAGSSATLTDADTVDPTFTPDEPGDYTLTLTVDDGELADADAVLISADAVDDDTEGPITSLVELDQNPAPINTDVSVAGWVDDTLTGGSLIVRAEYSVDGDPFGPLDATDGAFDSIAEQVVGTIPADRFPMAAVYDVCVRGIDAAGNVGDPDCVFVAMYDPEGGFVTGGGWFDSPEGACPADPALSGRANFGFVAKYKKGRSVPDGQTEFMFSAGNLDFHSTAYEYLLVNKGDSRAQFKGNGTINGEGDYRFKIWATDDDVGGDAFRIRIWEELGGVETVIYDNLTDLLLSGGQITIHDGH